MKHINILGKKWIVKEFEDNDLMNNMGYCNHAKLEIGINLGMAEEQKADSLLHEVTHAVEQELKIGLTEQQVLHLATGLYSAGVRVFGVKEEL